jgi:hypothetical protein
MIRIPKFAIFVFSTVLSIASASDAFYLGTWKIASAVVAPWWEDPAHPPDPAETKTLVGKTVTIGAKAIQGPRQVACAGPRFSVKQYPADMLFEGMFGEMHTRNPSADPVKIAETVGFRGSRWKTLETGCGNEVNYHFLDPDTAAFGLNNYIYTLKKAEPK